MAVCQNCCRLMGGYRRSAISSGRAGLQGYCQMLDSLNLIHSPNLMLYSPLTSVSWSVAKLC